MKRRSCDTVVSVPQLAIAPTQHRQVEDIARQLRTSRPGHSGSRRPESVEARQARRQQWLALLAQHLTTSIRSVAPAARAAVFRPAVSATGDRIYSPRPQLAYTSSSDRREFPAGGQLDEHLMAALNASMVGSTAPGLVLDLATCQLTEVPMERSTRKRHRLA